VAAEEIAAYLVTIERSSMGLAGNLDHARRAVRTLLEWRDWIWEHAA
jgi:hypothetical protein